MPPPPPQPPPPQQQQQKDPRCPPAETCSSAPDLPLLLLPRSLPPRQTWPAAPRTRRRRRPLRLLLPPRGPLARSRPPSRARAPPSPWSRPPSSCQPRTHPAPTAPHTPLPRSPPARPRAQSRTACATWTSRPTQRPTPTTQTTRASAAAPTPSGSTHCSCAARRAHRSRIPPTRRRATPPASPARPGASAHGGWGRVGARDTPAARGEITSARPLSRAARGPRARARHPHVLARSLAYPPPEWECPESSSARGAPASTPSAATRPLSPPPRAPPPTSAPPRRPLVRARTSNVSATCAVADPRDDSGAPSAALLASAGPLWWAALNSSSSSSIICTQSLPRAAISAE